MIGRPAEVVQHEVDVGHRHVVADQAFRELCAERLGRNHIRSDRHDPGPQRPHEIAQICVPAKQQVPTADDATRRPDHDGGAVLDGLRRWTTLEARHVRSTWAGLRSFVADRNPVVGFAPEAPGFFWAIGQGGYGIKTSPAMGRMAEELIVRGRMPAELGPYPISAATYAPDRFC